MSVTSEGMLTPFGAAIYTSPLKWLVMLAPLGMVFWLSARVNKMEATTARALFFTSEIGSEISEKLYTAVAIALAYIYKINNGESLEEPNIEIPKDLEFNEDGTQKK